VEQESRSARERALQLLEATLAVPRWRLPTTEAQRLVWAIRLAVIIGIVILVASAVDRPLWAWLNLLIVPAVLAGGGIWFNRQQWIRELEVADQRAQDEALQAYLGQMSELLLHKDKPLLNQLQKNGESGTDSEESARSKESTLARARTLTVLTRLDGGRKRSVVDFLFEASLIDKNSKGLGDWPLKEADLREAHLSEAHLVKTNLSYARLREADLERADLRGADLHGAKLSKAVLSGAQLGPPEEEGEPNSTPADLSGADLSDADLSDADFSDADLSGAKGVTEKQLELAQSLKNATMPNGQKYEDWLNSRGEDGENSGPP
jgi:uncharacterized protein YjbI with pentapeptide repeats